MASRAGGYLARTVPNIGNLLQLLENTIHQRFIPALTGRPAPISGTERLPIQPQQLKGNTRHPCSCHLLVTLITQGEADLYIAQSTTAQHRARNQLQQDKRKHENQAAATLRDELPEPLQHARKVASEERVSSWLTALPLQHHGFAIHKGGILGCTSFVIWMGFGEVALSLCLW